MIRQDSLYAWIQVLIAFILMMVAPGLNTQLKAQQNIDRCIFNCADTDCGDEINIDESITRREFAHGTGSSQITPFIENWIESNIDIANTTCCNIRVADLANLTEPETGSSFNYTYKGFTVKLPGPCGGRARISLRYEGECPFETRGVNSEFDITVRGVPSPDLPQPENLSLCEGTSSIKSAFDTWVDKINLPFFTSMDQITMNLSITGLGAGFQLPCFNLSTQEYDLECIKSRLKNAYQGDCEVDISFKLGWSSLVPEGCDATETETSFTVNGVVPTLSADAPVPSGACANDAFRNEPYKTWIQSFGYKTVQTSCNLPEFFYIDDDLVPRTRAEAEAFFIDECRESIQITYEVGCGDLARSITGTMHFPRVRLLPEEITVCSEEPFDFQLDLEPLGSFSAPELKYRWETFNGMPTNDPTEYTESQIKSISALNINSTDANYTYGLRPIAQCRSAEEFCLGDLTTMTVHVKPSIKSQSDAQIQINVGDPLGITLNPQGPGLDPTSYQVKFTGFNNCSQSFNDGVYTPGDLRTLLTTQPTEGCTPSCNDQQATVEVTPMADGCAGFTAVFDVLIKFQDVTPPEITCPPDYSIQCIDDLADCDPNEATASDDCDTPTITCSDSELVGGTCGGTITRMYTATDASGNTNSCEQIITVMDNTAPTINCPANVDLNLTDGCSADTTVANTGVATASDNCSEPIISYSDQVAGTCGEGYEVIRTWSAVDACGNSISCDQLIRVIDAQAPEITCPADTTLFLSDVCVVDTSAATTGFAQATDNCGEVTITRSDQVVTGCGSAMTITRTWTATDLCGNTISCEQTIDVSDTTSPRITCPDDITLYLDADCQVDDSPAATGVATGEDNCTVPGDLEITHEDQISSGCGSSYTIQRTWLVTDACGNTAECEQLIMVLDTTPPTMDCLLSLDLGCNPVVPDASPADLSAMDNCGQVEISVIQGESIQEGCSFRRRDTYTAIDPCGNTVSCSRYVVWTEDTEGPVIAGVPSDQAIDCQSPLPPVPTDITATDACIGDVGVRFREEVMEVDCGGNLYIRSWTATDACGNRTVERQIIRLVDNIAPILEVPSDTIIETGEAVPEPTYTVIDDCSAVTVKYAEVREDGLIGEYVLTRNWTARDGCGNEQTASQVIRVEDRLAPSLLIVDPMIALMEVGESMATYDCEDPGVSMSDVLVTDNNPEVELATYDKLVSTDMCDKRGYYRKWKCGYVATDGAGNETEFYFYVLQYDTLAPQLEGIPADVEVACDDTTDMAPAQVTALDACQGNTAVQLDEEYLINPADSQQTATIRTWTAMDGCGNTASASQTIAYCGFDMDLAASGIGNRVWMDLNGNGTQDINEPGINGVKLNLYWLGEAGEAPMRLADSTYSGQKDGLDGWFMFDQLFPGHYQVEIVLPEDLYLTRANMEAGDSLDSDVLLETGMTTVIELDTQQVLKDIDVGLITVEKQFEPIEVSFSNTPKGVQTELQVFPNPTRGMSQIKWSLEETIHVEYQVMDMTGRTIWSDSGIFPRGDHLESFDLSDQPDGMYWVHIRVGEEIRVEKLLKYKL